jgi:hypothetical protein
MRGGPVSKACTVSVVLVPVCPFVETVEPLDVPLAAGRTWVPGSRARTAVEGTIVRPLAVVRVTVVRRDAAVRNPPMWATSHRFSGGSPTT